MLLFSVLSYVFYLSSPLTTGYSVFRRHYLTFTQSVSLEMGNYSSAFTAGMVAFPLLWHIVKLSGWALLPYVDFREMLCM